MSRKDRIPKSLAGKLRDLDDHVFLLRSNINGLKNGESAHVKQIAAELRTLICFSSGTEGLLWRLTQALNVSDEIYVSAPYAIDRENPITHSMSFSLFHIQRGELVPEMFHPQVHSLKEIVKEYEAIYLSSLKDKFITHELLIKSIAQQMGSAHEDDGIDSDLVRLLNVQVNGNPSFLNILLIDAEFTLEIAERVLQESCRSGVYKRKLRKTGDGDLAVVLRYSLIDDFVSRCKAFSAKSFITGTEINVYWTSTGVELIVERYGSEVFGSSIKTTTDDKEVFFVMNYSSKVQCGSVSVDGETVISEIDLPIGWIEARDLHFTWHDKIANYYVSPTFQVLLFGRCLPNNERIGDRLLSMSECLQFRRLELK
ncbi:hypothetical protein [Thalassoglobus sp.]|uniref:hypothetical protein n=1 Tax=Thalassoglobus sp. TaxID=2795869 RepID=UPI003AA9B251